jgi:hypothetical protein
MRIFYITILFVLPQILFAQKNKINSENYYNHYASLHDPDIKGKGVTTNWLRLHEVVPIIIDELKKAGYKYPYSYKILKIDSTTRILISAFVREPCFGILYIEGHYADVNARHRSRSFEDMDYRECEETLTDGMNCIRIKKLPENIFWLSEDWYWYQYTDVPSDDKFLVTKEIAISILREDIQKILTKAPKPKVEKPQKPFVIIEKK